jgi:hypothetical protein
MPMLALLITTLVAASVAVSGPAYALRVWVEGTEERPLSIADSTDVVTDMIRSAPGAMLERAVVWQYSRTSPIFEPFSVTSLDNGNVLIASRTNEVLEVDRTGRVVWSYTRVSDNAELVNVYSAERLPNGNTLITDRRADFVIEVTPDKQVVWRYGVELDTLAPGSLVDPFSAQRLPNGNTLITDNRFATRVLEIRTSDYDPSAPNLGYTEESIVWRYGNDNDGGTGPGQLASPRYSQRLPNGNTLITDSADQVYSGNRVIEVTPGGEIVWQYGVTGVAGTEEGYLYKPACAIRLPNGNTVISEEDGKRILEVSEGGELVDLYGPGEILAEDGVFSTLRGIARTPEGTTLVCDQANERVVEIGFPAAGVLTSEPLTLGMPGVRKAIGAIQVDAEIPEGTAVSIAYSLDGGAWVNAAPGTSVDLPSGTVATQIRYRLALTTESAAYTPVIRGLRIIFDVAPPPADDTGDDGDDGDSADGTGDDSGGGTSGSGDEESDPTPAPPSGEKEAGSGGGSVLVVPQGPLADPRFQRGTLLEAVTSTVPGLEGFGIPGGGPAPESVALALLLLGVAYTAGVVGSPISVVARSLRRG